jgi:uncharacterized protein YjbI with pentapeptide repeats
MTGARLTEADFAGTVQSRVRIDGAYLSPNAIKPSAVGASGNPATSKPSWCS